MNNSVIDCSYMREIIGYRVFRELGLLAPRMAFTNITVNGEDYGLYQLVEIPDDVWLRDNYEDASGNLYDGGTVFELPVGWISNVDFTPDEYMYFQLEEGEDVSQEDVFFVTQLIQEIGGTDSFYSGLGEHLDWELWHQHVAAEWWTGHCDGYWLADNNFRVYFDPIDGLIDFITWDLDYAFLDADYWGLDWRSPYSIIGFYCMMDETCLSAQMDALQDLLSRIDENALIDQFEKLNILTLLSALNDPRSECDLGEVEHTRDGFRDWLHTRSTTLRDYWGIE